MAPLGTIVATPVAVSHTNMLAVVHTCNVVS